MIAPSAWVEVNLKRLNHNLLEVKRIINSNVRLMAVVKANAYGHGMIMVARQAVKSGADMLAVARLDEAIELREAGINLPVLVFGFTHQINMVKLIEYDLTQTVFSFQSAKWLSEAAGACGKKIKIHLKIDTGMGRTGFWAADIDTIVGEIIKTVSLSGLEIEGIYTHFASADGHDKTYAKKQYGLFLDILNRLRLKKIHIPVKHAANSAAIIDMPETHMDMVRAGIMIYGLYPSEEVQKERVNLKPVMTLKTIVTHLKKVPAGFKVSYGSTYKSIKPTVIATVPMGYSSGLNRLLSSSPSNNNINGYMLLHGCKVPIAGRVCMDMTMLDVGNLFLLSEDVRVGDEVVVFGEQEGTDITVDQIAKAINTINYEVVTGISDSLPRINQT
ncbi:MAG: alanine racemase [Desulfosarcina sp.]|nr:alanine racemase [Desulfobacterales bacterium]